MPKFCFPDAEIDSKYFNDVDELTAFIECPNLVFTATLQENGTYKLFGWVTLPEDKGGLS